MTQALKELEMKYPGSIGYFLKYGYKSSDVEERFTEGKAIDKELEFYHRDETALIERSEKLAADLAAVVPDSPEETFLMRRMDETRLLLAQLHLADDPTRTSDFQKLNATLFGNVDSTFFTTLYAKIRSADVSGWVPESAVFEGNLAQLESVVAPLLADIDAALSKHEDIVTAANTIIKKQGWDKNGWTAKVDMKRRSCVVAPRSKQLLIGSTLLNETDSERKRAILAHEFVHVMRSMRVVEDTHENVEAFEEGIAHLVEIIAKRKQPYPARFWRYLAIGLSQGCDGTMPRTAKQVFDVLLPLYEKYTGKASSAASHYVFGTVTRVWQGSPLEVPGVALARDLKYTYGSRLVWNLFSKKSFSGDELRDLLTAKVVK